MCAGGRRSLQLYNWLSYEEELHPPLRLLLFWLPAATTWPCKRCTLPLSHRQQGCYLYRVQGRGWDADFSRQTSLQMQAVTQTYLTVVSCFKVTACRLFLLRELLMTPMEQVADKPVVRCQGGCRGDTRNK